MLSTDNKEWIELYKDNQELLESPSKENQPEDIVKVYLLHDNTKMDEELKKSEHHHLF